VFITVKFWGHLTSVKFWGHLTSVNVLGTPYLIIEENKRICFIFSMLLTAKAVTPGISYHVTQRRDKRPSRMELPLGPGTKTA